MTALQEMFSDFGCTVLNYTSDKIIVNYFYSEEMYKRFLGGADCMQGMGIRDPSEVIIYNKLPDGILVVVQNDGVETARYQYFTLLKATISYKDNSLPKKNQSRITFRIRKQKYGRNYNLLLLSGESIDFKSLSQIKDYLAEKYLKYKIMDWELFYEQDASC